MSSLQRLSEAYSRGVPPGSRADSTLSSRSYSYSSYGSSTGYSSGPSSGSSYSSGSSSYGSSGSSNSGSSSSYSDYGYYYNSCGNYETRYERSMRQLAYFNAHFGLSIVTFIGCLATLIVALKSVHLGGWGRWVKAGIILLTMARLFSLANDSMQMGILHSSQYADINIRATIKAQYAFVALVEILGDTAAVAVFLAIMSLCSNLVRGSHAGAMRVGAFVLAGLLELLVVLDWAFNVAYYAYSVQSFDSSKGVSRASYEQTQSKIADTFVKQVKIQWALAIFELVVVLVAVARAVSVLVRSGGGGKSAAGSKAPAWLSASASIMLLARAAWRLADVALSYDPITGLSNPCHLYEFWRPYIMNVLFDPWMVLGALVCLIVAAQRISAAGFASTQYA